MYDRSRVPGFTARWFQVLLELCSNPFEIILVLARSGYYRERTEIELAVHVENADGYGDVSLAIELVRPVYAPPEYSRHNFSR